MFSIFGAAGTKERASFALSAHNLEELTVQALADLLAYMDTHEVVFSQIKVLKFDPKANSLSLEAFGEKKRPRDSVKAVTYHELLVTEDKKTGEWAIRILLDV